MLYIKHGESISPDFGRSVRVAVVLGHMDGLHRGHVMLLSKARSLVGKEGKVVVMSFTPHAKSFFKPEQPPFMLQTIGEKLDILPHMSVDMYYEVSFDQKLANCLPQDFIDHYLVEAIAADFIVVGEDFRFGKGRKGTVALLAQDERFHTYSLGMQHDRQFGIISSSKIRAALAAGDVEMAETLLGRPYTVWGEVGAGEGIASKQGVATANLSWHQDKLRLRLGVYIVCIRLSYGKNYYGLANFGLRPTFGTHLEPRLEAHLFDFNQPLYGQSIGVSLLKFMRDECKFTTKEKLFAQIAQDIASAKDWLGANGYTATL